MPHHSQVGWGSEQPGPAEDAPAHCRGLGYMAFKGPCQPKPVYDSMKFGPSYYTKSDSLAVI